MNVINQLLVQIRFYVFIISTNLIYFFFLKIDEMNILKEILCQSKKYLMRVKHTGAVTLINVIVMGTSVAMKKNLFQLLAIRK